MRFRLIEDHREIWPVRVMCEALSVSPSGYYAWRSRPDSLRKIANRELLVEIRRVHARHRERYGAPRIHAELRAEGRTVSRKRVERVMRQHGIQARPPRPDAVLAHDPLDPLAADGLALGPQFGVDARRSVSFPVLCMNPPDVDQQRAIGDLAQAHRP